MGKEFFENIKVWKEEDPLESFIGKRILARKGDREFVATLVAIVGDELYFRTKAGKVLMDCRSEISHIQVIEDAGVAA